MGDETVKCCSARALGTHGATLVAESTPTPAGHLAAAPLNTFYPLPAARAFAPSLFSEELLERLLFVLKAFPGNSSFGFLPGLAFSLTVAAGPISTLTLLALLLQPVLLLRVLLQEPAITLQLATGQASLYVVQHKAGTAVWKWAANIGHATMANFLFNVPARSHTSQLKERARLPCHVKTEHISAQRGARLRWEHTLPGTRSGRRGSRTPAPAGAPCSFRLRRGLGGAGQRGGGGGEGVKSFVVAPGGRLGEGYCIGALESLHGPLRLRLCCIEARAGDALLIRSHAGRRHRVCADNRGHWQSYYRPIVRLSRTTTPDRRTRLERDSELETPPERGVLPGPRASLAGVSDSDGHDLVRLCSAQPLQGFRGGVGSGPAAPGSPPPQGDNSCTAGTLRRLLL
eukprot:scaffold1017_cov374-Prasinococcus_capsulatus_cf.AAC.5